MIPDRKVPVARQPTGGQAFALTDGGKVPIQLFRDPPWIYVGTVGVDGVDYKLKYKNPHPYAYGDTPGPPAFTHGTNVGGTYEPVSFRIGFDNRFQMRGVFTGVNPGQELFTIPAAFWTPPYTIPYLIPTTDPTTFAQIVINTTGSVVYNGMTAGAASTGVTAGSYGDASHVAQVTVTNTGIVSNAASVAIQIPESQVTGLVSDLASDTYGISHRARLRTSATSGVAEVAGPNMLVPTARLGTSTADNTTFLRGDQTWATPSSTGASMAPEMALVLALTGI